MAQTSRTSLGTGVRRRSQRVLMQVTVQIRGTDFRESPFEEETVTLAINAHGALVLLRNRVTSGTQVVLRHKGTGEEQECHVVFLGPMRSGKVEIGLEFTARRPTFWRIAFPPEDWTPKSPEARIIYNSRDHKYGR